MTRSGYECSTQFATPAKPLLVVISGPSGVGKDAVLSRMKELGYPFAYIVTATTRPKRGSEREGVDYLFISEEKFGEMVQKGEFLEYARVYGNWYGVPKAQLREALIRGKDVIVKVDIQGAATIKKAQPQAVFIFLVPPSLEELLQRLNKRCTESPAELAVRISMATEELKKLPMFDYAIINKRDGIDEAISEISAVITAERCRVTPREIAI